MSESSGSSSASREAVEEASLSNYLQQVEMVELLGKLDIVIKHLEILTGDEITTEEIG
jgi:hypothetical protein